MEQNILGDRMLALLQRVNYAKVVVDNQVTGSIEKGILNGTCMILSKKERPLESSMLSPYFTLTPCDTTE